MKGIIRAKLKRPGSGSSNGNKDEWSKLDQRIWHSVAANQPVKLATKFSKHPNINVNKLCPSVGYSVVHYAAAKGLDDCLNVLLAHNANNRTRDITGATPLHASARYGHKGTTSKLLATSTVNVNARDDNQCTALHFAAFEGHLECLKLIAFSKDCDIHCVDKDGRTTLMVAAAMGRLPVCRELIKLGVNVNHRDSSSLHHTALTLASEAGHSDVVRFLCESGANYNYKLSDGRTAVDIARARSRRNVVDALHVIQLTEAAKKTDRGVRLSSTSSSGGKSLVDKSEEKTKNDHHGAKTTVSEPVRHHNQEPTPLPRKFSSPISDKIAEERVSPSSNQNTSATILPLYNDSKHGHLYDRDVSLYDSKSTLASVSSLDVSNVLETSKTFQNERPTTPQLRSKDASVKQTHKLTEELVVKEEQIAQMEIRLHDLVASSKREIECLKNSNLKYERSVQELERANDLLSQDCMKLQREKKEKMHDIERLQEDNNEMEALKKDFEISQEKLMESEMSLERLTLKSEQLGREKQEMIACYEQEKEKLQSTQSGLYQLLSDIGLENVNQDYNESLKLLKCEIEQLQEKNDKKIEQEVQRKHETEQLATKILEQDDVIQELKIKLVEAEKTIEHVIQDRNYLLQDRSKLESQLQEAADANCKHASMTSSLQDDLSRLREQLALEELNHREKQQLEERLHMSLSIGEQTSKNYEVDKTVWKRTEATLEGKIEKLTHKYNEAKQEVVDHEKTINQLRAERNHREALVSKLEKDLESMENRRKEVEVDVNRTRQQLTESKQKCSTLEDEIVNLRRSKKDLSSKLNSVKLYECTELERKKIDSMKLQLENLCEHIQESEKKYNETISAYRGHLLMAAKGELNPDVLAPLREILKLQEEPHSHDQL